MEMENVEINPGRHISLTESFCHQKHNPFELDCAQSVPNVMQRSRLISCQTVCNQQQANVSAEQLKRRAGDIQHTCGGRKRKGSPNKECRVYGPFISQSSWSDWNIYGGLRRKGSLDKVCRVLWTIPQPIVLVGLESL